MLPEFGRRASLISLKGKAGLRDDVAVITFAGA
jgi:hypothetical protein